MTTKKSNLINVGVATSVFGIKGWLKIKSYTEPVENILNYSPWWLKTSHGVKAFEVDDYKCRSQGLVVHLKGVDDRDLAATFCPVDIAIERQQMPELEQGDFYWDQLIGLKVISQFEGKELELGIIASMLETGANDVIVVKPTDSSVDSRERILPYIPEAYVKLVDLDAKTIWVDWDPEF